MTAPARARQATYRVQVSGDFDFRAVAGLCGYLRDLGVSHLHSSPWLQAVPGSTHGYDVVDHGRVSSDLGGDIGLAQLRRALRAAGLGVLLDIVPNHMAVDGKANRWWWDVLENGRASEYARYFDIDWDPPDSKLRNRVLLPILPDHYGRVLEAGKVTLRRVAGTVVVVFGEHEMPVDRASLGPLVAGAVERLAGAGACGRTLDAAARLAADLGRLPRPASGRPRGRDYRRTSSRLLAQLVEIVATEPAFAAALDEEALAMASDADRLDAVLEAQNYRLAWWRTGADEVDYRRFFDIAGLVALRQEHQDVFTATHRLVLRWLSSGDVDGVRIDHIDGLRNPKAYLDRLATTRPGTWVVPEKILVGCERLPEDWRVAGTTGYDWLNVVGGLFVDPTGEDELTRSYVGFTGQDAAWDDVAHRAKLDVLRGSLATDVRRLAGIGVRVCEGNRRYRDYSRRELERALEAILAAFPVYRTYVTADSTAARDRAQIHHAAERAMHHGDGADPELLEFIGSILTLDTAGPDEVELALRFQQLSGAVMAKGIEDTAFYRYVRLVSLNEVGGDPSRFGTTVDEFHQFARAAQRDRPFSLLSTATHDTKRGEDVRARLAVLSEVPAAWEVATQRWAGAAARHRTHGWPDPGMEWLWYQTIVGAWPLTRERAVAYMGKAAREAKLHTSWESPQADYEAALAGFAEGFLADRRLTASVETFVESIAAPGFVNALGQKLLSLTAPGIPDLYQGTELWDLSLVDPDNRRAVDFAHRRALLDGLGGHDMLDLGVGFATGTPKLLVVARVLALRAEHPDWFGEGRAGRYEPMGASGPADDHVVAFMRGDSAITVVPRLTVGLARAAGWGRTALKLPPGTWRDRFTGATMSGQVLMSEMLAAFPVALLTKTP